MSRDVPNIQQWKGQKVYLVELSVSHYLMARMLEKAGMKESDVIIKNVSDEKQLLPSFTSDLSQKCVVTWNPMVMQIMQLPGVNKVFCSSEIPGEILDLMVVRTDVLKANPELAEALVGAWYEVMNIMTQRGPTADKAMGIMAESAGCSVVEYKNQLKTTAMFYKASEAVAYTKAAEIKTNMDNVRKFCFKHKLLGENAQSADDVGIQYPDGTVQGSKDNVQLIFDASFMQKAADAAQ
jgi:NitT/TauT family transport system substrate-binding protein